MILSALLTSVGLNLGLCLLFLVLFSILRKLPGNVYVYATRLVAEGKARVEDDIHLESFIPSTSWLGRAWRVSEDDLLASAGLDAVVLMRIFQFSFRVFLFAAIVGIFILVPFNYMGSQLSFDFTDLDTKTLEAFSISNINDGSARLWIHFSAVYTFTIFVCYLLYYEYRIISSKRIAYFQASKPQPHDFTILVRSIPVSSEKSVSENVESLFSENYPDTYLSHRVIHKTRKLKELNDNADKMYRKIAQLRSLENENERFGRIWCFGFCGGKVDLLEKYEKELENIEDDIREEQAKVMAEDLPAAFVSFKTRYAAESALRIRLVVDPTKWITEGAPGPKDVHWPFFSASFISLWISSLAVLIASIILTLLFLIPVIFVQGLANLEQLELWFPFLTDLLKIKLIGEVVTGYLPSFILQQSLSFVPPIFILFSSAQGFIAFSQIERSACLKILVFTIWNIFFASVFSGTALYRASLILEPAKIPELLAVAVPAQASFFIAYVVTGWTNITADLFRLSPLIMSFINRKIFKRPDDEFEVPSVPYHSELPRILFFGLLGITYFFLAPLILPFLLVYYCLGYIVYRNQLLNVYASTYETGGTYWPIVHDSTIFSLVLMHLLAIGIFGLKKVPIASSLIIPLPILTLIFNSYCRKRFLPIFKTYSAETLIKKDREDQKDHTLPNFHDKLATAYKDPTLLPVRSRNRNNGTLSSPLLGSGEP